MMQLGGRHYEVGMSVSVSLPDTTLRRQLEAAYRALETLGRDREKWRREVVALDAAVKSAILQRDALLGRLEDGLTWRESFRRPYEAAVEPLTKALTRASAFEAQCVSISEQFVGAMKMLASIEADRNVLSDHLKDKPEIIAKAKAEREAVSNSISCQPKLDAADDSDSPTRHESSHQELLAAVAGTIMQPIGVQGEPAVLSRLLAQSITSVGRAELERLDLLKQLGEVEAEREAMTERDKQTNAERDALFRQVVHQAAALEALQHELNAVYRSHSWRLTSSFRKIARLLLARS
jgi:chromosome segregation ATPase